VIDPQPVDMPILPKARLRAPRLSPDRERIALRCHWPMGALYVGPSAEPAVKVLNDGGPGAQRWPLGWIDDKWILISSWGETGQPRVGAIPADAHGRLTEVPGRTAIPLPKGAVLVAGATQILRWEPKRGRSAVVASIPAGTRAESLAVSADGESFACAFVTKDGASLYWGGIVPRPGGRQIWGPQPAGTRIIPTFAGRTLHCLCASAQESRLLAFDRTGRAERLVLRVRGDCTPELGQMHPNEPDPPSPFVASEDGQKLAMVRSERRLRGRSTNSDLWMMEVASGNWSQLTTRGNLSGGPYWPDPVVMVIQGAESLQYLDLEEERPPPPPPRRRGRLYKR
jgi:hypothetical protein